MEENIVEYSKVTLAAGWSLEHLGTAELTIGRKDAGRPNFVGITIGGGNGWQEGREDIAGDGKRASCEQTDLALSFTTSQPLFLCLL